MKASAPNMIFALLLGIVTPAHAMAATVSTEDGLAITLSEEGEATSVVVDGEELVGVAAPVLSVRDVTAAGTIFAPSLLYNGSFEIAGGPLGADGWTVYRESKAEGRIVATDSAEGEQSLFAETDPTNNANGSAYYLSSPVAVTGGERYRLSAQFRTRHGYLAFYANAIVSQRDAWEVPDKVGGLYITWFDDAGAVIASTLAAPMSITANHWRRITGEVVAPGGAVSARLLIGFKLADSGQQDDAVWVDDVSMIASPEPEVPVTGTVSRVGDSLVLRGSPGALLDVEATFTPFPDRIEVRGRVTDRSDRDRALEVTVRLPLDLLGYRWWDSIRDFRTVTAGEEYANRVSAVRSGMLPMSLYPLAALEDGPRGIAAGLPLDEPRVALLRYGPAGLEARFHLGISPVATRPGAAAMFTLSFYRYDGDWGFRRALAKFRSFHPAWFETARPVYAFETGAQGFYLNPGSCAPGCTAACEVCCTGASVVLCHDQAGIASFQYTAPEGNSEAGANTRPPPPYDDVMALLTSPPPGFEDSYGTMLPSLILSENGTDRLLKKVTTEGWTDAWVAAWALNMDPEIPGGHSEWTRTVRVDGAFAATESVGAVLDGVQFDNFMSAPEVDLDPAHLPFADYPLTYDPVSYRPAIHAMASLREHMEGLRAHIDMTYGNAPAFGINAKGIGTLNYLAPLIDVFSGEGELETPIWERRMLDYRRALAYKKPLLLANQSSGLTVTDAVRFTEEALFWGIMPKQGPNGAGTWEEGAVAVFDAASDMLKQYWEAGWEPITYAATDNPGVPVERFGSVSKNLPDSIYFTVHNLANPDSTNYVLTVDTTALGIPDPATVLVTNLRTSEILEPLIDPAGTLTVTGSLGGYRTDVIRLTVFDMPLGSGDANCDGHVDAADLDALIARLFAPGCPAADVNEDGRVSAADLSRMVLVLTETASREGR